MTNHYTNILEKIEERYHSLERYYGQTVYKLSKDGFVYLRYSSKTVIGKKNKVDKYFFGIETDTIEKLRDFDFTVILICGEESLNFILNKDVFLSIIDQVPVSRNQWKLNLFCTEKTDELQVTGKLRINISEFKNRFDLIFSRIIYLKSEITKEEFRSKKEKTEYIELTEEEKIKSDLISSSINIKKPSLFEEAIASCFKFLGFECEHVGGAGNTDVFISTPYRVIIEAKTTTRDSVDKIYFTRLKQHKEKFDADFIVVICNDFKPSVIKDAEIENSVLIQTKLLHNIIDLNQEYPISPFDLEYIFKKKGLLKEEDLQRLANRFVNVRSKAESLPIIIKSLDNEKRNVDEIYGRYQIRSEELKIKCLNKSEFVKFINFLSMPFLDLIAQENNLYYRNINEDIAIKRFFKLGGIYEFKN